MCVARRVHGEEADGSPLQLPGSVWVGWLPAAGPWGDRAHHRCRTLSGSRAVCPVRTLSGCEEGVPKRQRRRQNRLVPQGSPSAGTSPSVTLSFLSTR